MKKLHRLLQNGLVLLTTLSSLALAQVNEFDMWIEPGCPQAGDQITLYTEYYQGFQLMTLPASVVRSGSSVRIAYTRSTRLTPIPIFGYPPGISLGTFAPGNYRLEAAFNDVTAPSVEFAIDIVVAPSGTPAQNTHSIWYNPAASGYGISLFRGDRAVVGTYYSYRNDKTGLWKLMQRAYCTPTGYAGSFFGYNNGNPFESPDSAWTVPPNAINEGRWVFNFAGTNTATIFERGNLVQPNLTNTRNLTRLVIP